MNFLSRLLANWDAATLFCGLAKKPKLEPPLLMGEIGEAGKSAASMDRPRVHHHLNG